MKGMELARAYYEQYGRNMILSKFPTYADWQAKALNVSVMMMLFLQITISDLLFAYGLQRKIIKL